MGVYIKGMEMPKTCDDCFLPLQYCPYAMKPDGVCPLIEVPEPHGRLGDLDELFRTMENKGWFDNADRDIAEDIVLNAATIIPVSEEGET